VPTASCRSKPASSVPRTSRGSNVDDEEEADSEDRDTSQPDEDGANGVVVNGRSTNGGSDTTEEPEDEGIKPLPERLVFDLTAQKTLALRNALASDVDIAFVTVLHALVLQCSTGSPRTAASRLAW
jgi:ParB family chromosome partitioning protein